MSKDFAPYEESFELQELGFGERCFRYQEIPRLADNKFIDRIRIPTWQQAFRFFREKYNLFSAVNVDQTMEPKFCYSISKYAEDSDWAVLVFNSDLYYTYEEAELALLRKLIETVKDKEVAINCHTYN